MSRESDEMEQIRRGLESFLNEEMQDARSAGPDVDEYIGNEGIREEYTEEYEDVYDEAEEDENVYDEDIEEEDDIVDEAHAVRTKERKKVSSRQNKSKSNKSKNNRSKNNKSKNNKSNKKKKHIFRNLLIIVLLLAGLVVFGWYRITGSIYSKMTFEPVASLNEEPMMEEGVTNILLIGNDSRENGADGRSDAMILLSVSNETNTIHLTSLLRDMYVEIPGHNNNRLNAAYAYGGAELLLETIKLNFGIDVNRYVLVNFQAFANLIDAAGGVDLELTNDEVYMLNAYLVEYNILENRPEGTDYLDADASGMLHLNGPQALAYSRNRYIGSDFGRTERQRKVLEAVIKKAPSALLSNGQEMMAGILPNLTTNLTEEELRTLSLSAAKLLSYEVVQASIPLQGTYQNATIREMAVLEVDFEANREYIRTNIYGETTEE